MSTQRSPLVSGLVAARLAFLLLAGLSLPAAARAPGSAATSDQGRLIVLGFDGADWSTVLQMMDKGEMQNCARLRAQGTAAPLGTTMPAESPVSWASLNSGQNPGKTGVPGFIKRDFNPHGTPIPALGHVTHDARATSTFHVHGLAGILAKHSAPTNATIAGGIALAGFLVVFALLLRIRRWIALVLAALLGAMGAVGAWVATGYVPREIADVVGNPTKTDGFWEVAAKAGVPCVVLDAAMEWDKPDVQNLKLLAGLGVPDVRANNGDWFRYTTSDAEFARVPDGRGTPTGGRVFRVDERDGRIQSFVYGPRNFWLMDRARAELASLRKEIDQPGTSDAKVDKLRARMDVLEKEVLPHLDSEGGRCNLPLEVDSKDGRTSVSIGGQAQEIKEGGWSSWYHLTFELNPLVKVKAITRCKLVKQHDPFELYVDFLQIDPADPMYWQPVARPSSFGAELGKSILSPYETVGWACMTMPFKDREIDPKTFLEDIETTHALREKLLFAALERDDWRVLVDVESTPDRVQHMMYQFYDTGHPAYDAQVAAQTTTYFGKTITLSDAIPATYREMDRVVGKVMDEYVKPGDTLMVCADHGFQSFRRQVHLNNWLAQEGFLTLRPGAKADDDQFMRFIDWPHTRAYALGLGMIFVNLQGRERGGTVKPDEVPALLTELREKLMAMQDPVLHQGAMHAVYETSRIHSGAYLSNESDLMVGFAAGWRVSWATSLGGLGVTGGDSQTLTPAPVFEDNLQNWSGDHVSVAADLVPGVFLCNRKVEIPKDGLNLLHIAPTALSVVGVKVPPQYDLPALHFLP